MVKDLVAEEIKYANGKGDRAGGQDDRESDLGEWAISMGLIKRRELEKILTELSGGPELPSSPVSPDAETC